MLPGMSLRRLGARVRLYGETGDDLSVVHALAPSTSTEQTELELLAGLGVPRGSVWSSDPLHGQVALRDNATR
jgi:hypothetical protein